MYILFDHINHKAYFGKTFIGIYKESGVTKRRMLYMLEVNKPVKGYSCVIGEECKLSCRAWNNLYKGFKYK